MPLRKGTHAKVLQAAQTDPLMRAVLTTLLFTGLRIDELLALRV